MKFADHPDVRTAGELAGRIRAAAAALLPADALVASASGSRTRSPVPAGGRRPPLDPATRKTAAQLFDRIATALEAVK